jgi:hypothetical protein
MSQQTDNQALNAASLLLIDEVAKIPVAYQAAAQSVKHKSGITNRSLIQ